MGFQLLAAALSAAACCLTFFDALHMLQLESYQLPGYFRWLSQNTKRAFLMPAIPSAAGPIVLVLCLLFPAMLQNVFAGGAMVLGGVLVFVLRKKQPAKKPLVVTKRAGRLIAVHFLVNFILSLIVFIPYIGLAFVLLPVLSAVILPISASIAAPMERIINRWYFRDAQRMLLSSDKLIRIGITGSYGKTSTKFILGTILSEKYKTLVTPSSFNTPMGVTRVIREQLQPEHEVFVAEMGARHVGDIKEMCELVHPEIGVLTSVGPQHLETFGSIENVASTKYELIEALPRDGMAFFAADGGWCEVLYNQTDMKKALAGLKEHGLVYAKDIAVSGEGSSFTLVSGEQEICCKTPLLGRHNVQNIALCAAVALYLGLTMEQVASGIAKLEPVEHRLQLIKGAGGVTVIDDAFNSNPAGAQAAMEVLGGFEGRRIVVTPGMVELGAEEEQRNREFGRQIAKVADIALLIGVKRTEPIKEGMLDQGFPKENIYSLESIDQASAFLAREGRVGDVVLFENDLPDNY